ncbi:DUF2141 domain-containing protein [Kriegella sp. EG-1]|nr:DUF2141 domain-containing protein [Flavobacteriaceae bacterium EG-1]
MHMKKLFAILLFLFCFNSAIAQDINAYDIEVTINNIENDEGQIRIGLYNSADSWLKNIDKGLNGTIENGTCKVIFKNVSNGTYAISSYHDENSNNELDSNMLGFPKETVGSSNNAPAKLGPPKWDTAKFVVNGESLKLTIDY